MKLAYGLVALTIACGVYGQMILKWQAGRAGELPSGTGARASYLLHLLVNPWVLTSLAAAGIALLAWIGALSLLDLSRAYPFVSASFVLVLICSAIFFGESVTVAKVIGALLIVAGLIIGSQA
jgi:multidrug transporter EmrE-like cation transporter